MSWRSDYNYHAQDGESYSEFIERKKAEQASTSLFMMLFTAVLSILRRLIVYSPMLYIGYVLTEKMLLYYHPEKWVKWVLTLLIAYITYSLVYFTKGLLIGLKYKGNRLWMLVWVICVLTTCVIPGLIADAMLQTLFPPETRQSPANQAFIYAGSIVFGWYVYSLYKFKTPCAPAFVFWSYSLGHSLIK